MKKMKLNTSRYGIWMNEIAFPDEAVNTIGFQIYFPEHGEKEVRNAADDLLAETALFHMCISMEEGEPCLTETAEDRRCGTGGELSLEEAEFLWEEQARTKLAPGGCQAAVYPVREGGCCLIMLFHHVLLDGYSMCRTVQHLLDTLDPGVEKVKPLRPEAYEAEPAVEMEGEKKFWLEYFDDADFEPFLFTASGESCRRSWYHFGLGPELTEQIRTYARARDLPESAVFSAALSLYLARAARTGDAVFLMPRLNRDTDEKREMTGCFTLVVPVRVPVADEISFEELCRRTVSQSRLASAHKAYGMENIINDLRGGGLVTGAVSEYTLNYYSTGFATSVPCRIRMSMDGAMHNHLTLNITSFRGEYEILYDARDGVYTKEMTERFHESILHIIRQALEDGDAAIPAGNYEILGPQEQDILMHMEGKRVPVSSTASIPSLFREAVSAYPGRPALYAGEHAFTFRELDELSSRAANALLQAGIRQGQAVMYQLQRDYRLIPVMLGILKAGAAFIPIDPQYPKARIDYIQENSGSKVMIVNHDRTEHSTAIPELTLLDADKLLDFPDSSDPCLDIPQEQLAYCIYTSGTTGRPKGVQLSHRGIVNIVHTDNNPFNRDIAENGRGIVAIGSVCFDISLFEFFVPLLNGMFIEFAPESAMADPVRIAGLLEKHGANMLHCTPSRLAVYLHNHVFTKALAHVEVILAAGETLPGSLVDELRDTYGIRIYNGYGPTETTIGATITEAGDNSTIGRPIANMGVMVLDGEGRMVPYGTVGEIYIYGRGLGLGYRNLPEETALRFVNHYGRAMYRTGDLGRFLPDGRIEYHGRNDFQVKLRGLRIELSEIENSMLSFPGIGSACVQVRTVSGSQHLVGFYTVKDGAVIQEDSLKEHLKARLTLYMVPDIVKKLEQLPQTPGGKTDLKALSNIPVEYVRVYREPVNAFQRAVCEAFEAVLEEERVGLDDNFFEIGGDSLHTAELVCAIEDRIPGIRVAYEDVFRYPVPELLAQRLYWQSAEKKEQRNPLEELDYSGIPELLSRNEVPEQVNTQRLGNILITGVTGFLGLHILMELLKVQDQWERIYCLVRPTKRLDPEKRLKNILFYYGDADYGELFGARLFALSGDLAKDMVFDNGFAGKIDTVINCAANVSHFAYDDKLERINVGGVRNLLKFCEAQKAALVQISTISVGGVYRKGGRELVLTEKELFVGQKIKNQYILSKFMAEYEILRAAVDRGIPVKLMRVGNLQGRMSDGEFQMNHRTNAFIRQIASYVKIGRMPESLYRSTVNFSPVDEVARMIVVLSRLPEEFSVFHVYPEKEVAYERIAASLASLGHSIAVLPDEEFEALTGELEKTRAGRKLLEGILIELPDFRFRNTGISAEFTQNMLGKLGAVWTPFTDRYLEGYFRVLEELQIFEEE